MTKLMTPVSQYIDGTLFSEYYPLIQEETPFSVFGAHPDHIKQERKRFIESEYTYLPNLRPSELDVGRLVVAEHELTALKLELPKSMPDPTIRRAYHWRINEDLANISMVLSAARGDVSKFRGYNLFLYGAPRADLFGAVCDWLVHDAEEAHNNHHPKVTTAATEIISALSPTRGHKKLLIPEHELFHAVREREYAADGFMHRLMEDVEFPVDGMINAKSGDKILRKMLANLDCPQAIEDAGSWSVTATALRRPISYSMTKQEFIEYVSHEFRHVIEYRDGSVSRLELTSTGLDHYSLGNEGRGVITEQITNETFETFTKQRRWYELLGRHLAVSLSCGLAGKNKNFAETYAVIRNALLIYEAARRDAPVDINEIIARADDQAWDLLISVYEGTDGTGKGGGWRRPMIYLEGSVELWHKEADYPGAIELGDIGKFDVGNTRHITIIKAAGILRPDVLSANTL